MDKALFLQYFENIDVTEKITRMQTLAKRYSLMFKGLQTFSRWGQSCTTGVFEKGGREFVFVPGNTITLG